MSRVRDILRGYYGIQKDEDDPSNDTSIDGAGFKAEDYIKDVFATSNLHSLVSKTQTIREEIKQLDESMQMLVYENYNKFIKATDTIRDMKVKVEGMDGRTGELADNIDRINKSSDVINTGLSDRRTKIEELNRVRGLLKKLQFVFELPARIQRCMEVDKVDKWGEAVRCYNMAEPYLQKYVDLASFSHIRTESADLISRLRERMQQCVADECTDPARISQCVTLLIELRTDPESLRDTFITSYKLRLQNNLSKEASGLKADTGVNDCITALSRTFLADFNELCASYKALFVEDSTESRTAIEQLHEFTSIVFEQYFSTVRQYVSRDEEPQELLLALEAFHTKMKEANDQVPEAKLIATAEVLICDTLKHRVSAEFGELKKQATECLNSFERATGAGLESLPIADLVKRERECLTLSIQSRLRNLKPFLDGNHNFMESFTESVVQDILGRIHDLFLTIGSSGFELGERIRNHDSSVSAGPTYSLLAAKMCKDLEVLGLDEVAAKLQQWCADSREAQQATLKLKADLTPQLAGAGLKLLSQFVDTEGQRLSQQINHQISITDWHAPNDGEAECVVAGLFAEALRQLDERVSQLFPDGHKAKNWRTLRGQVKAYNFDKAIAKDIDKLFAKKPSSFKGLEFKRCSVLSGVLKIGLKTFTECMRIQTLGTAGLHLVQIDTYVLRLLMRAFTDDESSLDAMLDETISSSAERCMAPTPLETPVLESVCESKLVALSDV